MQVGPAVTDAGGADATGDEAIGIVLVVVLDVDKGVALNAPAILA